MDATRRTPAPSLTGTPLFSIDELGTLGGVREPALEGPNAFLYVWFQLMRTAEIHALGNAALERRIQRMLEVTNRLVERDGRISFQCRDKTLFINSAKLKLSSEEYRLLEEVVEFLDARGLAGVVVEGPLDHAAVAALLSALVYADRCDRVFERIELALREAQVPVKVTRARAAGAHALGVELDRRSYAFLTYSRAIVLYRTLLAEERPDPARRHTFMRRLTRTMQALVDICLQDDHTFLGLTAVKAAEEYAAHHAVNTALLSIVLGQQVGLGKVALADLGTAALFHDFGMRGVPQAILEKQGALEASERAIVAHYLLESIEFQLGERTLNRSALARIAVALDHHRRLAGRPVDRPDLFSRIVAIAVAYDALTTDRPWRKAYLPDEALHLMVYESEGHFDPVLLRVFVNALGLYPIGTLVRLDTGEVGLVIYGGGEGERIDRPVVGLVTPDGRLGRVVDLTERDASGRHCRSIVRAEDPRPYGLQPAALLAGSPL